MIDNYAYSVLVPVLKKLERIRLYLKTQHIGTDGRLDEGDQYAVRVIESRERFLNRLWNVVAASDDKERIQLHRIAHIRDVGKLFLLGDVKHSQGNIDCRACDRLEVADPEIPEATTLVQGARVCPVCESGIQHLHTARVDLTGVEPPPVPVPTSEGVKLQPNTRYVPQNRIYRVTQGYTCDHCSTFAPEKEYQETVEDTSANKGKWIGIRL